MNRDSHNTSDTRVIIKKPQPQKTAGNMEIGESDLGRKLKRYLDVKDQCSETKDWTAYADMFDKETGLVDHHGFGKFKGREEIRKYITQSIAPFGTMYFFIDWVAYDVNTNAVVFQVQNALPGPPFRDGKEHFQFPNWTRLVFTENDGENGAFILSEETVYNPLRDAGNTVKAWREAGGTFLSKEQLKYKHSIYPLKDKIGSKM